MKKHLSRCFVIYVFGLLLIFVAAAQAQSLNFASVATHSVRIRKEQSSGSTPMQTGKPMDSLRLQPPLIRTARVERQSANIHIEITKIAHALSLAARDYDRAAGERADSRNR
jgi:hypothetical protein